MKYIRQNEEEKNTLSVKSYFNLNKYSWNQGILCDDLKRSCLDFQCSIACTNVDVELLLKKAFMSHPTLNVKKTSLNMNKGSLSTCMVSHVAPTLHATNVTNNQSSVADTIRILIGIRIQFLNLNSCGSKLFDMDPTNKKIMAVIQTRIYFF